MYFLSFIEVMAAYRIIAYHKYMYWYLFLITEKITNNIKKSYGKLTYSMCYEVYVDSSVPFLRNSVCLPSVYCIEHAIFLRPFQVQ